jgi:hypothetical protein
MTDQLHPLFAVENPDSDAARAIASLVQDLNEHRSWSHGEIALVDELDETPATEAEDEPIWTLGGMLTLRRPTNDLVSERLQYEDVEFLIDRLCRFSSGGRTLVIEYGQRAVHMSVMWLEPRRTRATTIDRGRHRPARAGRWPSARRPRPRRRLQPSAAAAAPRRRR